MQLRSLVSVGLGGTIPQVFTSSYPNQKEQENNYFNDENVNNVVNLRLCLQVNQLLSLFFIIMVQVVITTEWYVINMPLQTKVLSSS